MRVGIYLIWLCFWGSGLTAQTTNHSYLVQLKDPHVNIHELIRKGETVKEVWPEVGLWEIQPDWNEFNALDIKTTTVFWEQHPMVNRIMPNRLVSKRVAPNDPFYGNQPYYQHIGLEYVWNYSKNGLNRFGDTLVVAYIDDGADTSHPDLIPNLYQNFAEIPWNGTDDDGNGYVDDYWGWNSGDQSPLVFSSTSILDGHGTNVAGVLGARGNNGAGVSGTNWHVKVLPVNTYPDDLMNVESAVIRGMLYVYKQKKIFLESNKTKGINIVALNMSLGMDNAFAEDAPYWCSLYDSLGSVGVWCYNATTNRNIDVGIKGDIPTLCPSKFLISVNVSTIDDVHYSSGYSDTFIELSAPGVNIYTTMPVSFNSTKPYTTETGTSFASPMVTAVSALMEEIACEHYLKLKRDNPDSAMALWREWLRSSVKQTTELKSKTMWGGRIDATSLMETMVSWCVQFDTTFTKLEEIRMNDSWEIWPNPSEGILNISTESAGEVRIFDATGRICFQKNLEIGQNRLELEGFQGMFWVEWKVNGRSEQKKVSIF